MRLNRRARLAKRLLEGADRALGSDAAHVWKALRILVVAAGQQVYVYGGRLYYKKQLKMIACVERGIVNRKNDGLWWMVLCFASLLEIILTLRLAGLRRARANASPSGQRGGKQRGLKSSLFASSSSGISSSFKLPIARGGDLRLARDIGNNYNPQNPNRHLHALDPSLAYIGLQHLPRHRPSNGVGLLAYDSLSHSRIPVCSGSAWV